LYERIITVRRLPPRVREYLMPTEEVVVSVRMHPMAVVRSLILILGGLAAALLLIGVIGPPSRNVILILWAILLAWQGWKIVNWWYRYFVITENRLMLIEGIFEKSVGMMPLGKVTDMRLEQSVIGRMFGYAAFVLESAGQEQALSRIPFLPYPTSLYQEVLSLIFPGRPPAAKPPGPREPPGPQEPPSPPVAPWPRRPGDDPGFLRSRFFSAITQGQPRGWPAGGILHTKLFCRGHRSDRIGAGAVT
jgi:membrane protein YdbS with pleckstrin-like domain